MNREIKFRAWDVENKRMVYFNAYERFGFIQHHLEPNIKESAGSNQRHLSTNPEWFLWMQFTGLKDKNGVEIYEDDVVRCTEFQDTGIVVWHESRWAIEWSNGSHGDLHTHVLHDKQMSVIGNIYENPELLESPTI